MNVKYIWILIQGKSALHKDWLATTEAFWEVIQESLALIKSNNKHETIVAASATLVPADCFKKGACGI